jgi:hypothetical protein
MTKIKLFIFPAVVILLTSIQAFRLFFAQHSPFSFTGIDAVIPGLIAFCMISYFALIVKEKYWRVGITLAGLAFIARSCINGFPDKKLVFVVSTLALNLLSVIFLFSSWRVLGADFTLEEDNQRGKGLYKKAIFIILVIVVITGIFMFWSRE